MISPDMKIACTLLKFKDGHAEARLGVLSASEPTEKLARERLAHDVAAVLRDPVALLDLAVAAAQANVDTIDRERLDAALGRLGYRRPPVEVHAPAEEPLVALDDRRLLKREDLRPGMLVACEWAGSRPAPMPMLAFVEERTPGYAGAEPGLFLVWVNASDSELWWTPGNDEWHGTWLTHYDEPGPIELVADNLLGAPLAAIKHAADLAGWPERFLSAGASLRTLAHVVLGGYDPAHRAAQAREAVGRVRHVLRDRGRLAAMIDGRWRVGERVDIAEHGKLRNRLAEALWEWRRRAQEHHVAARTDQEIVEQTQRLARRVCSVLGYEVAPGHDFRRSEHPRSRVAWMIACAAQEELTATDVDNAVAESEVRDAG